MEQILCRHFSGYKPCKFTEKNCNEQCSHLDIPQHRILVVHLEALGAVLRATSLLPGIKRKYPSSHITWITKKPGQQLLENNPLVDRVLTDSALDLMALKQLKFDISYCIDKSLQATGIIKEVESVNHYGFIANSIGSILPATKSAEPLWQLGLDNYKKFFINKKSEVELMYDTMELKYKKDEYQLFLNDAEKELVKERKRIWSKNNKQRIIGINTGCSNTIRYKKLSIECHIELIEILKEEFHMSIVLLGGKEDQERNEIISRATSVYNSPANMGIRDGLCSVEACDYVFSGDSLGMHMAIALRKPVVAWFGPTCSHEIELYGRGEKIHSKAKCGPCWKRTCSKDPMCYELVDFFEIVKALEQMMYSTENQGLPTIQI